MQSLAREHWGVFRDDLPDRAGSLAGRHTIASGCGEWAVDRWPDPRVGLAFAGGSLGFWGSPAALDPGELRAFVERKFSEDWERVLLDADGPFEPVVRRALRPLQRWERVCYELPGAASSVPEPRGLALRKLSAGDAGALASLSEPLRWIADPWDEPARLAGSGLAWGAFEGERLVSVAAVFLVGGRCEELGVVTELEFRERGASAACSARLISEVRARGRRAVWSTSTDNLASQRVAEKLGFRKQRDTFLLVAGEPMPVSGG